MEFKAEAWLGHAVFSGSNCWSTEVDCWMTVLPQK